MKNHEHGRVGLPTKWQSYDIIRWNDSQNWLIQENNHQVVNIAHISTNATRCLAILGKHFNLGTLLATFIVTAPESFGTCIDMYMC